MNSTGVLEKGSLVAVLSKNSKSVQSITQHTSLSILTVIMIENLSQFNTNNQKRATANIVRLETQQEALNQAYADAATSGARVFLCHIYQQGGRYHLGFSMPLNVLVELARLQSADKKKNKSNADSAMNRPEIPSHTNTIVKYLLETETYILPPFIFNCSTPITVFSYGTGAVQVGYAIIPSNIELYVTDGQHRLKAIKKVLPQKPQLRNDSVTVLIVQEEDMDQIHQDFADCARTKPISTALLTAFDVSDVFAKLTRDVSKQLVIFNGRIDKISRTVGKDPNYMFTMNQLKIGIAEFLYGSPQKQVIESRSEQTKNEYQPMLEQIKTFYTDFAENNETWEQLLQPASETFNNIDLYNFRQQRIDFNSVGFQIISRVGHQIFFEREYTYLQRETLIKALASLDFSRDAALWKNSVVIDDEDKHGNPTTKIIANIGAINKGFRMAIEEIENLTGIELKQIT